MLFTRLQRTSVASAIQNDSLVPVGELHHHKESRYHHQKMEERVGVGHTFSLIVCDFQTGSIIVIIIILLSFSMDNIGIVKVKLNTKLLTTTNSRQN